MGSPIYRCARCLGTNVQIGMWVPANATSVEPASLEWIHDEPVSSIGLSATFWCADCESHDHGVVWGPEWEAKAAAGFPCGGCGKYTPGYAGRLRDQPGRPWACAECLAAEDAATWCPGCGEDGSDDFNPITSDGRCTECVAAGNQEVTRG